MKIKLLFILCLMLGLSILSGTASGFELRGFVLDNTNETAEIGFGLDLPDASIVRSALDDGDELELACRAELHGCAGTFGTSRSEAELIFVI
ncbi:MAG: hypothetical protein R6V39_04655 [Desulfovibrionales bacterium]